MEVGIRELKSGLSGYLKRVRRGERIVVTDRGVPVARIESLEAPQPPADLLPLIESGELVWRDPHAIEIGPPIRMAPGEKTGVDFVREQRR